MLHCEGFDKPCADIDWFDCDYGTVTVEQGDTIVASFYNLQQYEDMELIAGCAISWFGQHFQALKDFCNYANISREDAMRIFELEEDELD